MFNVAESGLCFDLIFGWSMSLSGTTRTFRNVRYSVAVGCKADIEQAASKMLDL
jgi:hypothetical protein